MGVREGSVGVVWGELKVRSVVYHGFWARESGWDVVAKSPRPFKLQRSSLQRVDSCSGFPDHPSLGRDQFPYSVVPESWWRGSWG